MAKTEKLIAIVKHYPILYDVTHEDYKNVRKKEKVYNEIGSQLNESGEYVKKKWKNLRDTYAKYVRSTKINATPGEKKNKKWLWADRMREYRPHLTFAETCSNVSDIDSVFVCEDPTSEHSDINLPGDPLATVLQDAHSNDSHSLRITSLPATDITPSSVVPTKQRNSRECICEPSSSASELIKYFENSRKPEYDATDSLFLAYAKTIKTFSGKRQAITKMKIAEVIMEQELLHYEEQSSTNCLPQPESVTSYHSHSDSLRRTECTSDFRNLSNLRVESRCSSVDEDKEFIHTLT